MKPTQTLSTAATGGSAFMISSPCITRKEQRTLLPSWWRWLARSADAIPSNGDIRSKFDRDANAKRPIRWRTDNGDIVM